MNKLNEVTVKKLENYLTVKNYSKNTINIYISYINDFICNFDKNIYHINNNDISDFIYNYGFKSISQQNQYISAIKQLMFFTKKKNIDFHFLKRPKKEKKLPKVIDKSFLLDRIHKIENLKHKTIISLAYSTGMRVSEVINLKIDNIDSKRMVINIVNGKGKKDRIVPLSENMLTLLRGYYLEYKPKEYLFNGQNSLQYSSTSCNQLVKKYIGSEYHFHLLRHSCFTALLESGVDLRIIQSIAGHTNSKTTEIYTHVSTNLLSKISLPI